MIASTRDLSEEKIFSNFSNTIFNNGGVGLLSLVSNRVSI